jgi:hypothetical protein
MTATLESEMLSHNKRMVILALIRRSLVPDATLAPPPGSNPTAKLLSAPCGLRVLEQSLAAVARGNSKTLASFLRADNAPDLLLRVAAAAHAHATLHGRRRLAAVVRALFRAATGLGTGGEGDDVRAVEAGGSEGTPLSSSQAEGTAVASGAAAAARAREGDEALCRVALHAAANMLQATAVGGGGDGSGASTAGAWPLPLGDVGLDLLSSIADLALMKPTAPSPGDRSVGGGSGVGPAFLGAHLGFLCEVLLQCLRRMHAAAAHHRLLRQIYRRRAAGLGAGLGEDSLGSWSTIGKASGGGLLFELLICSCFFVFPKTLLFSVKVE